MPSLCPSHPDLAAMRGVDDEAEDVHWHFQFDSWEQHVLETDWVLLHRRSQNTLLLISHKIRLSGCKINYELGFSRFKT